MDEAVSDAFGYHALQLGFPMLDGLRSNRMPHRWLAHGVPGSGVSLSCHFEALPFDSGSLDLLVLPHTLELSSDPHATLREVERVLVPEGRLVVTCFNPASLWGVAQKRAHLWQRFGLGQLYLPRSGEFLAYHRLRDWLHLLNFEIETARFGAYRFALREPGWFERFGWMESVGARWWPILGSLYCVTAVKRVRGMRLIGPAWKTKPLAAAPVRVAKPVSSVHHTSSAQEGRS